MIAINCTQATATSLPCAVGQLFAALLYLLLMSETCKLRRDIVPVAVNGNTLRKYVKI